MQLVCGCCVVGGTNAWQIRCVSFDWWVLCFFRCGLLSGIIVINESHGYRVWWCALLHSNHFVLHQAKPKPDIQFIICRKRTQFLFAKPKVTCSLKAFYLSPRTHLCGTHLNATARLSPKTVSSKRSHDAVKSIRACTLPLLCCCSKGENALPV